MVEIIGFRGIRESQEKPIEGLMSWCEIDHFLLRKSIIGIFARSASEDQKSGVIQSHGAMSVHDITVSAGFNESVGTTDYNYSLNPIIR